MINFFLVLLAGLIIIASLVVVATIFYYNKYVSYKNRVREAWSGIDIQIKKRNNIIPNLTNNLQSFMSHEKNIFDNIYRFRTMSIDANTVKDQTQAEELLEKELSKLIAVSINYPELKSDKSFIDFQKAMEEVESDIEKARRYYNALVRDNNNTVEQFPGVIIANAFNFVTYDFFEI